MSEGDAAMTSVGGSQGDEIVVITTTFPSREAAEGCGRRLIEAEVAACVQVEGPITSVYRWQGRIETAPEWRCTCKTTVEAEHTCVAVVVAGHPYEVPQVVVGRTAGTAAYVAWVRQAVRPS